jgi:hypothetical protein
LILRLKADWVTFRSSAEREKLLVRAKLRKSSIHFSSMAQTSMLRLEEECRLAWA